jgi:hypothetical protein
MDYRRAFPLGADLAGVFFAPDEWAGGLPFDWAEDFVGGVLGGGAAAACFSEAAAGVTSPK